MVQVIFLTISIVLAFICVILYKSRGEKLINVNKSNELIVVLYILFVLGIILLISQVIKHFECIIMFTKNDKYISNSIENINDVYIWNSIESIVKCIIAILGVFISIIGAKTGNTITEKGIYIQKTFYKWDKIEGYKWIDENNLEFIIKKRRKSKKRSLEVELDVNRTEVDKILKEYIKENKEYVN